MVKSWNKAAEIHSGIQRKEIVGKDFLEFLNKTSPSEVVQKFERAMQERIPVSFEQYFPEKGFWVEFLIYPSRDGLTFYVKDINEKKERFIEILAAKNNTEALINASNVLLWSVNSNFELVTGNEAYKNFIEKITGVRVKDGESMLLPQFKEEDRKKWKNFLERSLQGETFSIDYESINGETGLLNIEEICFNPIYNVEKDKIIGVACSSRDITTRQEQEKLVKQHNQVLQEKEQRLQKLTTDLKKVMNSSLDVICSIDKSGKFLSASAASLSVWGYTSEELKGRSCLDFVAPEYREISAIAARKIMSGMDRTNLENVCIRKDGSRVPILWSAKWDEKEETVFCVAKDATSIKDAERLKNESDQKFIALVQNNADIIAIIDENANYSFTSANVQRILGYDQFYFVGKNAFEYIHPDDVPKVYKEFEKVLTKDSTVQIASFRFRHADGSWRWIETSATNLSHDPVIKGIVINSRDVTEKKTAELLLKESKDRYDLVAKATNDIIWDWDLVSNNIYWSENFKRLLDIPSGDNNYNNCFNSWIDNIHVNDKERVFNKINQYVENPCTRCLEDEYRFIKSDGKIAFIQDKGYIQHDETGKAVRMVGAMRDITDKKLAEIEKAKITKDLIFRNKELEQFTYIVSHNLRAPVANIIGFAEELQTNSYETDVQEELLSSLSLSVNKLDKVIRDLNDILQLKDEVNRQKEIVSFSCVINDIKISIQNLINESNVTIETDFSEAENFVTVRSYLYSMFYNFISNSIKFRKPGKIPVITIRSVKTLDGVRLEISDNGLGIDLEKDGKKIFGLYSRLHASIEGKGMGLFMTKTQIESLGGSIKINSEVNKGTTFSIFLPEKTTM